MLVLPGRALRRLPASWQGLHGRRGTQARHRALVASGVNTGVKIEVRAGGPAIGFQQVSAQMYADKAITLGMVPLDEAIQNSKDQPVTGVMTPYDIDPLVIMWDPARYPQFSTIADIGQTDTRILFFSGERTYIDYLLGTGQLRASQVDGSYDGSPDRMAASRGAIAVQGFATSEPWKWQNEVKACGKPLTYQLVSDSGYPNYRNLLAVRTGDRQRLDGCLRRLVPMFQQATVEFMAKPGPAIGTILSIIERTKQGYTDSTARSEHAVRVMRDDGLITNGKTPNHRGLRPHGWRPGSTGCSRSTSRSSPANASNSHPI